MTIPIFEIGLISSIITELLKLFPVLNTSKERRQAVSFLVAFVLSLGYLSTQPEATVGGALVLITGALASSFAIYKSLVEPTRKALSRKFIKKEVTEPVE